MNASRVRPALAAALARLPDRDRDVLLLTAIGELSYAEVAFALGIPEGTVGSRLSRARRKIITALAETRERWRNQAMPAIDDLTAVRRLLAVPGPHENVITVGRNRLDDLVRREARGARRRPHPVPASGSRGRRVAAAATLVATVVLPHAASTAHPRGSSATARRGDQGPRSGSVQRAILTAAGAVSGDIMYIKVTAPGTSSDISPNVQFWLWPARAAVGQRVQLVMAENGLRTEMTFTQAAHFPPSVTATTTGRIDPAAKTWTIYSGIPVPGIPLTSSLLSSRQAVHA